MFVVVDHIGKVTVVSKRFSRIGAAHFIESILVGIGISSGKIGA